MTATDDELRLLAASPFARVRMLVAERTALPAVVFELLVTDDDIRVAKGIAPHPALPADRLWALAEPVPQARDEPQLRPGPADRCLQP